MSKRAAWILGAVILAASLIAVGYGLKGRQGTVTILGTSGTSTSGTASSTTDTSGRDTRTKDDTPPPPPTPSTTASSGVEGSVLLGPTCPVMRVPPDPACADKPYATTIEVFRAGSTNVIATGKSDASGRFEIELPRGTYTLEAKGGSVLPRCSPREVTVTTGFAKADITCDSGIR